MATGEHHENPDQNKLASDEQPRGPDVSLRRVVLQLRAHGNCHAGGCSVRLQVHCCAGSTRDMTASTCMPQPDQVVLPQRAQRAGLHMWCSLCWLVLKVDA